MKIAAMLAAISILSLLGVWAGLWASRPGYVEVAAIPHGLLEVVRDGLVSHSVKVPEDGRLELPLPAGRYVLRVVPPAESGEDPGGGAAPNVEVQEREVELSRGASLSVSLLLAPAEPGFLEIQTSQEGLHAVIAEAADRRSALVFGSSAAEAGPAPPPLHDFVVPLARPLELSPGDYRLTFRSPDAWWRSQRVHIKSKTTTRVFASVEPIGALWRKDLGEWAWPGSSGALPAYGPGMVLIVPGRKGTFLLAPSSGEELGRLPAGGVVSTRPLVDDLDGDGLPEIVFGCWESFLYCFGSDGARRWRYQSARRFLTWPVAVVLDQSGSRGIVAADAAGVVRCFSADGELQWRAEIDGGVTSARGLASVPVEGGGPEAVVVAAARYGRLFWFASSGELSTEVDLGSAGVTGVAPCSEDGAAIVAATLDGDVHVTTRSGELVRHIQTSEAPPPPGNPPEGAVGAPAVADFDGDGHDEIVVASARGVVSSFEFDGTLRWRTLLPQRITAEPIAADADGDGREEVIAFTAPGLCYSLDASSGDVLWSFRAGAAVVAPPTAVRPEASRVSLPRLLLYSTTGEVTALAPEPPALWSFHFQEKPGDYLECADADGDGAAEVLLCAGKDLYCLDEDGVTEWRFTAYGRLEGGATVRDLDGDGRIEVLHACNAGWVYCIRGSAAGPEPIWNRGAAPGMQIGSPVTARPVVADLEADGELEVLVASWDRRIRCFDTAGNEHWSTGAPAVAGHEDERFSQLRCGDTDGDGVLELFVRDGVKRLHSWSRAEDGAWRLSWTRDGASQWALAKLREEGRDGVVVASGTETVLLDGTGGVARRLLEEAVATFPPLVLEDEEGRHWLVALTAARRWVCFSPEDGMERWSSAFDWEEVPRREFSTAPRVVETASGPVLVLIGSDARARAFDAATGALIESKTLCGSMRLDFLLGDVGDDGALELLMVGEEPALHCFRNPFEF